MITVLARILIKNYKDISEPQVRQAYGILCGMVGICLNIGLFVGKFIAGTMSKSISIIADAFNNLSDAGSSLVTLIGFKLAGAKPDNGHPFGHGRIEYISGLIVSGVIILMAFELIKGSVEKVMHPQAVEYTGLSLLVLLISIIVKLYMCLYNCGIGKKINSAAMRATAMDSLSDVCATSFVFIAAIVGKMTGLQLDGYCGIVVGLFIFYAGIQAAKETLNPLLGQSPEPEFVTQIEMLVMSYPEIMGIHDLIVHDYGPGRRMISLHAEVAAEGNMLDLHDIIDNIEMQLKKELKCDTVIHMDPIVTADERVLYLKQQMKEIIKMIDKSITMHDFRVVWGSTHTKIIFDVVISFEFQLKEEELITLIQQKTTEELGENYFCVICVDKA